MPFSTPDDFDLKKLVDDLATISAAQKEWSNSDWPEAQLDRIAAAGVYRWFVSRDDGGLGWSAAEIAQGYVALGSACLTSTFIVTQRVAALSRIAKSANETLKSRLLPGMLDGTAAATVGISHLTTSRRHVKPVMQVSRTGDKWIANGMAPWVTGGNGAKFILLGGVVADQDDTPSDEIEEILFVVPTDAAGVKIGDGLDLVALSASHTGIVKLNDVTVDDDWIVAGPKPSVLMTKTGGAAGGVQTSALALGLARSAINFIKTESGRRSELSATADSLDQQFELLLEQLIGSTSGQPEQQKLSAGQIRADVNSLVLRSTQAAMIAAKGAGFVTGHPVGRWCSEALFFLVWSCPQTVADANLCELVAQ